MLFFDVNFADCILDDVVFGVQNSVQIQVKFLYFLLEFLRLQHLLIDALFELILDFALKTEEHFLVWFYNLSNKLVIFFVLQSLFKILLKFRRKRTFKQKARFLGFISQFSFPLDFICLHLLF